MPTIYNGGQSPLEHYAIYGNPIYPGTGRLAIIGQTRVGTGKYTYQGPYKNPTITIKGVNIHLAINLAPFPKLRDVSYASHTGSTLFFKSFTCEDNVLTSTSISACAL